MPQPSDRNYIAVTRHRRAFSTSGRPPVIDIVDDEWASDTLPDDVLNVAKHEAAVAPLLDEGELDADAVVVSLSGNSSAAANSASERRQREEGWNDLGLDQFDSTNAISTGTSANIPTQNSSRQSNSGSATPG